MHRFFKFLIISMLSSLAPVALAAGGKPKPWGLAANIGYTNISFAGVSGSDFSGFTHYHLDFSILRFKKNSWQWFGLGFNMTPDLNFKDVRWRDGSTGNYLASFQTSYAFWGGNHKRFRWALLAGIESISWKGNPSAGASKPTYFTPGIQLGWAWKQVKNSTFPLYLRYWQKPARKITFSNYPDDSLEARAGSAIEFDVGVHYGF